MPGVRKTRKGRRKGRKKCENSLAERTVPDTPESVSLPREQMCQVDPELLVEVQAFNTGYETELCAALDAAEAAWCASAAPDFK